MTTTPQLATEQQPTGSLSQRASDHLWMHFTRHSTYAEAGGSVPVIVPREGPHIWDDHGRRYLDALSGLFFVHAGHGRPAPADAAPRPAHHPAFSPLWAAAHPRPGELAQR